MLSFAFILIHSIFSKHTHALQTKTDHGKFQESKIPSRYRLRFTNKKGQKDASERDAAGLPVNTQRCS